MRGSREARCVQQQDSSMDSRPGRPCPIPPHRLARHPPPRARHYLRPDPSASIGDHHHQPTSAPQPLQLPPFHARFPRLDSYGRLTSAAVSDPDDNEATSTAEPEVAATERFLTNRTIGSSSGFGFGLHRPSPSKVSTTEGNGGAQASMPILRKDSFRWLLPKISQRRLVCKNGECNISRINIDKRGRRYLADIFTTLVDIKWRWNLLVFTLAFTLSWIIFALLWWLIAFSHQDLDNYGRDDWKPCVQEVYDFPTALLFSIETQQTIGYGSRYMQPNCPHAIVLVMAQSCFGIIIQALMTGLVFAKLSRPKKRANTLMFSKNAVVCPRDGQLYLLFRVGDMRKSHIVEAQVRAIVISKRITDEGEVLPLYQRDLSLGGDGDSGADGRLFLVWPVIVQHRIDADSPLWDISADDLLPRPAVIGLCPTVNSSAVRGGGGDRGIGRHHFEILVVLEGIVESTGMTTQARTSYLPHEILWGHRFERLVRYRRDDGLYLVDYARFHHTVALECEVSRASARRQAETTGSNGAATNNNKNDAVGGGGNGDTTPRSVRVESARVRRRGITDEIDDGALEDLDDAGSSRSESPATTASRTLQLAVGAPSVQMALTPVIGRRRPTGSGSGSVLQELSIAAFDLSDECSVSSTGMPAPVSVDRPFHQQQQQQQHRAAAADRFHPATAASAFTRAFSAVGLPSSPFDLQR